MNIYQILTEKLLVKSDLVNSSYDKCVICCFIFCCLPMMELTEDSTTRRI